MTSQREDLVDRCKVEAEQSVEPKHTNRGIAFLWPSQKRLCLHLTFWFGKIDLSSNRCLIYQTLSESLQFHMAFMGVNYVSEIVSKSRHVRDLLTVYFLKEEEKNLFSKDLSLSSLVPIALGKYLFSFRTQKSSPVAAIILQLRETSKVPNYTLRSPRRVTFRLF